MRPYLSRVVSLFIVTLFTLCLINSSACPCREATAGWVTETVDPGGSGVTVGWYSSLAFDASGNPSISYHDYTNERLKYARYNGSWWVIETVDFTPGVGQETSLAFDPSTGNPSIAYQRYKFPYFYLKYARSNGSAWDITIIESSDSVGGTTSLAFDPSTGNPAISYYIWGKDDLKYARFDGAKWVKETVDTAGDVGGSNALAFNAFGTPGIAYVKWDGISDGDLLYAFYDGAKWDTTTFSPVDTAGSVGWNNSLAFDATGILPRIAYYDATNGDLKYAHYDFDPFLGWAWIISIVDSEGDVGWDSNSLAFHPSFGYPAISYVDKDKSDLKFAYFDNSQQVWVIETVDSTGDVGNDSSLAFDSSGRPGISYYDVTNGALKYAHYIPGGTTTTITTSTSTTTTTAATSSTITSTTTTTTESTTTTTVATTSSTTTTLSTSTTTITTVTTSTSITTSTTTSTSTTISTTTTSSTTTTVASTITTTSTTTTTTCTLVEFCRDADEDGYGDPGDSALACIFTPPPGYVLDCSDCDDADPGVNPGAQEFCVDQKDNDCDGMTDCYDDSCPPPCPEPCLENDSGQLDVHGVDGGSGMVVLVPVVVNVAPNDVDSFGFQLVYNTSRLLFVGTCLRGELVEGFDFFDCIENEPGAVTVWGYEFESDIIPQGASGVVALLEFIVISCEPGESAPLGELQALTDDFTTWFASGGCFQCGCCQDGDVNGNCQITPGDALLAFHHYLEKVTLDECSARHANVYNPSDPVITPNDALCIFKDYLEKPGNCLEGVEICCDGHVCEVCE